MPQTPIDPTLPNNDAEQEKLRRWRSEFNQDFKIHRAWLEQKQEWEDFYDGDQLSEEDKTILKARNQPEVVVNLIKPRIDGVIGDFLGRRVMMRARDRGNADFETAKHVTEALRYVEDQNRFDDSETQAAEDLFVSGVGWYKLRLGFDFQDVEIKIEYRPNEDIVVDRRARKKDLSDSKRLYETVWAEVEDLVKLYPDSEQEIRAAAAQQDNTFEAMYNPKVQNLVGDNYDQTNNVSPDSNIDFETFIDPERNLVRVINIYEREQKVVEFGFHPDIADGGVAELSKMTKAERSAFNTNFPNALVYKSTQWQLNSGIFICNKILEEKEDVRPHDSEGKFPFARALGHVKHGEERMPYGLVKQYISPQQEYNKRRSKLLHKINVNRIQAEEGAFANNDIERIRAEAAKPDGVIIHAAGRQMTIDKDKIEQADIYILELAHNEVEGSGVSREFIGTESKDLSGKAINLRQISGNKMLRPFFAALRGARRDIFTIALEEMQQYWTSQKLIKITDDPEAGSIILNQRTTDDRGKTVIVNNLRLGKYDIKIDEDAETPNQRQEIFQNLISIGQAALAAGQPFPLEMLIKSSDLPNKKEWLDAIALEKQHRLQMQLMMMQKAGAGPQQSGQLS